MLILLEKFCIRNVTELKNYNTLFWKMYYFLIKQGQYYKAYCNGTEVRLTSASRPTKTERTGLRIIGRCYNASNIDSYNTVTKCMREHGNDGQIYSQRRKY